MYMFFIPFSELDAHFILGSKRLMKECIIDILSFMLRIATNAKLHEKPQQSKLPRSEGLILPGRARDPIGQSSVIRLVDGGSPTSLNGHSIYRCHVRSSRRTIVESMLAALPLRYQVLVPTRCNTMQ